MFRKEFNMDDPKHIDQDANCAEKSIIAAMHMFSSDLIRGCRDFAEKAHNAGTDEEARVYNTACLFFATSTIEAKINEWISIMQVCFEGEPKSFWHALAPLVTSLKIDEKWNLIATYENGTLWDNGKEPFQSFSLIASLRNELVHYQGELRQKDTPANKKIKGLMEILGVESKTSFLEDDISAAVYDLLNSRNLGPWVASKASEFEGQLMALLNGSP
jgi:hypothetical protein